ncbi:CHASE domain-containing protein [Granulosicoccus antarcticus]|uniref:histidine kinase n=1 Tax=Granulosicoccus antarcticus IMCC3135 TaxID=1192854 RepID=A0A2Z2P9F8_9GAMM|nr:CHASE domain-containing protein [Granulosicoccus antarcticus]ASJ76524.1 Phytochrome-like protein cph1 [Granulosicoccus antarcticus IMCC3135]
MANLPNSSTEHPPQSQGGRIQPITPLHWVVLAISLLATLAAWQMSLTGVKDRTSIQFDRQADYAINLFEEQMRRYADVLHASLGFIAGSEDIGPDDWLEFAEKIKLEERHPAISGLGILRRLGPDDLASFTQEQRKLRPEFAIKPAVHPQPGKTQPYYLPVTHIAPQRLENVLLGLDVARESRRRDAIEHAVESADVQITAPIELGNAEAAGFLLIAPIYNSVTLNTKNERQAAFSGAVVASVITKNLAQSTLENELRQVAIKVSDGGKVIYNEQLPEYDNIDPLPLLARSQVVSFFGRVWKFEIQSTQAFRTAQYSLEPNLVLFGGLTINLLLLYLFSQMTTANRRAIAYGKKISDKYNQQSEELLQINTVLEERNEELQSFSYVVSHDLKSPLKGIEMLAECLEEDLVEQLTDLELRTEFTTNLRLIKKQVTLSQGLIKGVLEYSGLSSDIEIAETVDVRELLNSIQIMLAVEEEQLQLPEELPILETYQTQLFQVFMNLISNGYKYHEGEQTAVVTIRVGTSPLSGFHRFEVADNGPGIDPRYHQKIFDVFSTLQPKDHSMSSGVGLAIVKKLVCQHNGHILIESEPGQGSTFLFDWPCETEQLKLSGTEEQDKAA